MLFDGACPFCRKEVEFLRSRDNLNSIAFVDIDSLSYTSELYKGITYIEAMGTVHAITSDGEVVKGVRVFREAYQLVGLGWVYSPTNWPVSGPLAEWLYSHWASWRLPLTGRFHFKQTCKDKELSEEKT